MLRLFTLIFLLFNAFACLAEEVRISCVFDRPIAVPEMDAEAKTIALGFAATNLERVVLLELNTPKMLNGDMLFRLFPDGPTKVQVDNDQISLFWNSDKHPRQPAMSLSVNRFSLEAIEYFQIGKLGGQRTFSWTRNGKCKVDKRKF